MPASTRPRILVIDDEEYFRIFLSQLFPREQVEVVAYSRGEEALQVLERETFHLIVVDYQLPDMLGIEVLEWLQEHRIATPRVMVTGYGTIDVAVRALKNGATDFLTKPLADPQAFERFVHRTLGLEPQIETSASVGFSPAASAIESGAASRQGEIDARRVRDLCEKLQPPVLLSRREYEVIASLLCGRSNKEIAASLFISERTVKNHLTSIYRKFDVDGRSQLFNRILVDLS